MNIICKTTFTALLAAALAACRPGVPSDAVASAEPPVISPDYTGIDIPCNIAPMTFAIEAEGTDYLTHFHTAADPAGFVAAGRVPGIDAGDWHSLVGGAAGDTLLIDIYVRPADGKPYTRYATVRNAICDSIDRYISYRLIEPSYISFETMAICQRDLTGFDEREIYNSMSMSEEDQGQCINCHSYQDYNRGGNIQLHVRVGHGGTVVACDGALKKVNLKTPGTISSGVYPCWHPSLPLIAYSVNTTTQSFHSRDTAKVEVQDSRSDLILYDALTDVVTPVAMERDRLETFPYWHPDGRSLWYVSAEVPPMDDEAMSEYQNEHYRDFRYDLYRRSFDPETRRFGEPDTIFLASEYERSVTLPRPSPDGRYVVFTMGGFGTFHIWHHDSDLYMLDTTDGTIRPLDEINSGDTESYHSWSSDGRWMIFSSRRDDGSYTRLYLTHFGPDGRFSKPFRLPQKDPGHDGRRLKSYNIPEFMACPVQLTRRELLRVIGSDATTATFRP